jgi:hypothetical protein
MRQSAGVQHLSTKDSSVSKRCPRTSNKTQVGLIIYWVAVAAVLYSAGVPTPHWRQPAQYKPLGLDQLMFSNDSAPAMAAAPDTANLTGYVGSMCAVHLCMHVSV